MASRWLITGLITALLLSLMLSTCIVPMATAAQNAWQRKYRPLIGGIQIQRSEPESLIIASLGFTAYTTYVEHGIRWYMYGFVTASHFADFGDSVYQPTVSYNNYVGFVAIDPPFPRKTDSCFVWTETATRVLPRSVAPKVLVGPGWIEEVNGYTPMNKMRRGTLVYKVGKTTGRTWGYIRWFSYELQRPITWPRHPDITFTHYVLATYRSGPGDSGGTVFRLYRVKPDYPCYLYLYGIHVGVMFLNNTLYRIFCPVDAIIDDLGVYPLTV